MRSRVTRGLRATDTRRRGTTRQCRGCRRQDSPACIRCLLDGGRSSLSPRSAKRPAVPRSTYMAQTACPTARVSLRIGTRSWGGSASPLPCVPPPGATTLPWHRSSAVHYRRLALIHDAARGAQAHSARDEQCGSSAKGGLRGPPRRPVQQPDIVARNPPVLGLAEIGTQ